MSRRLGDVSSFDWPMYNATLVHRKPLMLYRLWESDQFVDGTSHSLQQ